ncbi:1341_t:CDS:2 [Paraglomus occultum]|uniref:1341_t:CDS:1 n=1 Tax=Paraglomus occultum TaxID=144539 RepID=A0A9N9FP39_9GLOM|nr:1341_t:CDS:2 [Paraglomus occultum]
MGKQPLNNNEITQSKMTKIFLNDIVSTVNKASECSNIHRPYIIGHRGSNKYPENTVLGIEQVIADGADGIEFDLQMTADDQIIICHDPTLDRTTTGSGRISLVPYYGVIEHLRTKGNPQCPIPRVDDIIEVIMRPENSHVFAVLDIKFNNGPTILEVLSSILKKYSNDDLSIFKTRLFLGIWHPSFLPYCHSYLPQIPIMHIGMSLQVAETYFPDVAGYNLLFVSLSGFHAQKFIDNARANGKLVFVWVVNHRGSYNYCRRRGVDGVMTDWTEYLLKLDAEWDENESVFGRIGRIVRMCLYTVWKVIAERRIIKRMNSIAPKEAGVQSLHVN